MAMTNAEKQAAHRQRQAQTLAEQASTIELQARTINDLHAQVLELRSQLQKAINDRHALEVKLLKAQLKAK